MVRLVADNGPGNQRISRNEFMGAFYRVLFEEWETDQSKWPFPKEGIDKDMESHWKQGLDPVNAAELLTEVAEDQE